MWAEIKLENNKEKILNQFIDRDSVEDYLDENPLANIIEINMPINTYKNAINNVPLEYWNTDNISDKGLALIKKFVKSNYDMKLYGELIALHNQEKWSEITYCCGSQIGQIKNIINGMGF